MLSLVFRTFEFLFYHLLISFVDRVSRLPRNSTPPDVMRLYRENLALKAQNGALLLELNTMKSKRAKMPMRVRAAQVFAYLLTRGNREFQEYYLAASRKTIKRWAARLRRGLLHRGYQKSEVGSQKSGPGGGCRSRRYATRERDLSDVLATRTASIQCGSHFATATS